jgi:hypothetical protein
MVGKNKNGKRVTEHLKKKFTAPFDFKKMKTEMGPFREKGWKLPRFCQKPLGNSPSSPIGWLQVFRHFPAAFLHPLRISQRLPDSLWAFPSGFPIPF